MLYGGLSLLHHPADIKEKPENKLRQVDSREAEHTNQS